MKKIDELKELFRLKAYDEAMLNSPGMEQFLAVFQSDKDIQSLLIAEDHDHFYIDPISENSTLLENEERLRMALAATSDGVWDWNLLTGELYLSARWKEILGYSDEELKNTLDVFDNLLHPDDVQRVYSLVDACKEDEQLPFSIEFQMKHKKGHWVDILSRGVFIKDNAGRFIRMVGTHQDVSQYNTALKQLKLQEEKQRRILDSFVDGIYITSKDCEIVYMNKAMERLLEDASLGDICYKAVYDLDKRCPWCVYDQLTPEGESVASYDMKVPGKDEYRTIRNILLDNGNKLSVFYDTTERKKFELALERLHYIVNQSPAVAFVWKNEEGWPVEYVSENVRSLFGVDSSDLFSGKISYAELIHAEDIDRLTEEVEQFSNDPNIFEYVHQPYRILTPKGDVKWVKDMTKVKRDSKGKVINYQGILLDITELRQALITSEQHQKEVEELLAAAHIVLKAKDLRSAAQEIVRACIRSINAHGAQLSIFKDNGEEQILLHLANEQTGVSCNELIRGALKELKDKAINSAKVVYTNRVYDLLNDEGIQLNYLPTGMLFAPLTLDGKTSGLMMLACKNKEFNDRDAHIVEGFGEYLSVLLQKFKTLDALEKRAVQLQELNDTKDRLFSIIGHDLRVPIGNIQSFAEILLQDTEQTTEQEIRDYTQMICKSSQSVMELLESLMQWSFAQRKHVQVLPVALQLNRVIAQCFSVLETAAQKKKISLYNNVPLTYTVFADPEMMTTVCRNLISNAIKFTQIGGTVEVSVRAFQNTDQICIRDNGIGMEKQLVEKLFSLDHDHKSRGTEGEKGFSLGLKICKYFIELNRGSIDVESMPEKGSAFYINLPHKKI